MKKVRFYQDSYQTSVIDLKETDNIEQLICSQLTNQYLYSSVSRTADHWATVIDENNKEIARFIYNNTLGLNPIVFDKK